MTAIDIMQLLVTMVAFGAWFATGYLVCKRKIEKDFVIISKKHIIRIDLEDEDYTEN